MRRKTDALLWFYLPLCFGPSKPISLALDCGFSSGHFRQRFERRQRIRARSLGDTTTSSSSDFLCGRDVVSIKSSPVDSSLSKLRSEDDDDDEDDDDNRQSPTRRHHPPPFPRNEGWLEEATMNVLDSDNYPVGELTEEDIETIGGLMGSWAKKRHGGSVHSAIRVERLLKRIIDEMRFGNNPVARVNTRLYTYVIEAWARSGARGAPLRAQHIHENMVEIYRATGDKAMAPSVHSYNNLLNAFSKGKDPDAAAHAENIFSEMMEAVESGNFDVKPDAVSFSTMLHIYSKSKNASAVARCEELFHLMDELNVRRNVYTYSALQNVYARSGAPDAPQKSKAVLDMMLDLYAKGDVLAKPNCLNYNAVLHALSRASSTKSAIMADEMLRRMELPVSEGGYDVEPERLAYALTILACARCEDSFLAARLAEQNLEKMESRAKLEEQRRAEVSSVAPPNVCLDIECFNVVLTAIARSRRDDACERTMRILKRMEQYADSGKDELRPNIRSWNAVLNAFARAPKARDPDFAIQAEQVLEHAFALHRAGVPNIKPNAFTFAAVLSAYQRSSIPDIKRAHALVCRMEELYDSGELDSPPDVYHMTILCSTLAKSYDPGAPARCLEILSHMVERHQAGFPNVKPNIRTYNAVLDCLCRASQEERAEQLLYFLLHSYARGDDDAKPDSFSFNSVIYAFCRSKRKGSGKRAEMILERFLEFQEENFDVGPDTRSFTHIIAHYGRSRELDAPYRAEYMLHRMISLYEDTQTKVQPNLYAFTAVIDSYAYANHPDAGRNAERLFKLMKKLNEKHSQLNLEVNTAVMNSLLFAWASCGDEDSGSRAEQHLEEMERLYEVGNRALCPDTRTYLLVLSVLSKSSAFDKAERALRVLRRMEDQVMKGNHRVVVEEHAFSLVINACAFSNTSVESELKAFQIAVSVLDEMLRSKNLQPGPLTFAWFLQACGRLRVPEAVKDAHIARAFRQCCNDGLVTGFVLQRLRGAASVALFDDLVPSSPSEGSSLARRKGNLPVSDLPSSWSRNTSRRK